MGPATAVAAGASVRSDKWRADLPEEGCADPTDGRRVHVVVPGIVAATGRHTAGQALASVLVNGQECLNLNTSSAADLTYFDWCRVHSNPISGEAWISFHTRNVAWLGTSLLLELHAAGREDMLIKARLQPPVPAATAPDASDDAVLLIFFGSVPLVSADNGLVLTYAATRKGGREALLHIHNMDASAAHTIEGCWYDGNPVAIPHPVVPAGGHVVLVSVLSAAKVTGDVWTARLLVANGNTTTTSMAAYGGRTAPERFPVESWARSSDCAIPGGNASNVASLRAFGVDSVFINAGDFKAKCGADLVSAANNMTTPMADGFHLFTDPNTAAQVSARTRLTVIDAVLTGDEVDGAVDASHLRSQLAASLQSIRAASTVLVYQGAKTTRNIGAFAGIADVQGCDAYCAACAPTMLSVTHKLPLLYPYYYLRNARDNTMPAPFWGYAQLFGGWSYQANANEIIAQIGQTILSGSKALMFFQTVRAMISAPQY